MQVYDLQISSATDVERINAQGDYIYYSSGSAGGSSPCVEVRGINTGFRVKLLPGQGMRLPMGKVERDWMIKPDASIAGGLIGAVVIGEGEIFDNRVTGSVEVIDGEKNRTLSGTVGIIAFQIAAVVGQISKAGLWNPAGSGKRAIVKKLRVSSSFAQDIYIGKVTAALANLYTPGTNLFDSSSFLGASKMATESSAIGISAVTGIIGVQASQSTEHEFIEPIIVKPGYGMVIQPTNSNTSLSGMFNFFEESDI